jgi:hypothetical protein
MNLLSTIVVLRRRYIKSLDQQQGRPWTGQSPCKKNNHQRLLQIYMAGRLVIFNPFVLFDDKSLNFLNPILKIKNMLNLKKKMIFGFLKHTQY